MEPRIINFNALNEKQTEAVLSDEKRLLVLAGAGSGKTKTLLQKIVYLIEERGVSPAKFCLLGLSTEHVGVRSHVSGILFRAPCPGS